MKIEHYQSENSTTPRLRGAGDVVALIAQPIAKAIDRLAGTKLQTCGGCKQRREAFNKALPIKG